MDTQGRVPAGLHLEAVTRHGRVLGLLGQPAQCIRLMRPLIAPADEWQKASQQQVADFYSQLGRCERMAGNAQHARHWLQDSLILRSAMTGDRTVAIEYMTDVAAFEGDAGRSEAAIAGYGRAITLLHQKIGEWHPLMVSLRRNIAVSYRDLGDPACADQHGRAAEW